MDAIPPDAFLAGYPSAIRASADALRAVVRRAVPESMERVRIGWRLIGYDVPVGRRWRYFAFVAPEPIHVHLGFAHGAWMEDPERRLEGAHLSLRAVRFVTFGPGEAIPRSALIELTREATRVTARSARERVSLALDRDWRPTS